MKTTVLTLLITLVGVQANINNDAVPRISTNQLLLSNTQSNTELNLHKLLYDSHGIVRVSVDSTTTTTTTTTNNNDINNLAATRKQALSSLCTCPTFTSGAFEEVVQSHPKDLQQIILPDGSVRRTIATATVGFDTVETVAASSSSLMKEAHPLELPRFFQSQCGVDAYNSLEDLRDVVASVVDLFVGQLDVERNGVRDSGEGVRRAEIGEGRESYRDILGGANHLEHFHVYSKPSSSDDDATATGPTLDYHTDAGFFLAFVPAMDCHSSLVDNTSFYLKNNNGGEIEIQALQFREDEVVIMMGAGAQYWLNGGEKQRDNTQPLVAASHALRLQPNAHRAWYGKMHLLPATLASNAFKSNRDASSSSVKYGDVLPTFQLENYKAHVPSSPVDGCGTTTFDSLSVDGLVVDTHSSPLAQTQRRRRLQHVNSPADCNNQTNFFCWHQCLDIPNEEHIMDYLRDGFSLYCLDPALLVSSGNSIAEASEPCKNGYTHNSNCLGSWQEKDMNAEAYEFPYYVAEAEEANYPMPDMDEQYCYGGTSMYMDGFNWIGSACVIYLFPQWVLSTPGKFALGCIGSILFGVLLESVLWKRRSIYSLEPGMRRLILSALVYGLQLTMGYFIMLVIMTYSGPLFVSTIGGMMAGHVLFNAQDSLVKMWLKRKIQSEKEEEEALGACCCDGDYGSTQRGSTELGGHQNGVSSHNSLRDECGDDDIEDVDVGCFGLSAKTSPSGRKSPLALDVSEATKLKNGDCVPEGATPCCQFTL
eukprot:g11060.t1 g11060   contig48:59168-61539(+)